MPRQFKVISGTGAEGDDKGSTYIFVSPEERLLHFRNVADSVLQEALDTWGEIWDQIQGSVTDGHLVKPQAKAGWVPECGWPEFLEKMWKLKHYLDYTKRFCQGKE